MLAPTGCVTSVSAGKHHFNCGQTMTFEVTAPDCSNAHCGVIVDMHGSYMNGKLEDANTQLSQLAPPAGFIVVQPNGQGLTTDASEDPQLVAFLKDLMHSFDADPKRVHMTGFSQGGFLTWRMLCNYSHLWASVAPGGAGLNPVPPDQVPIKLKPPPHCQFTAADSPSESVPILYMHGVEDAMVEYSSGERMIDAIRSFYQLGEPQTVEEGQGYRRLQFVGQGRAKLDFVQHTYQTDSKVSYPLLQVNIALRGHCYPGSTHHVAAPGEIMAFGCKGQNAFHWGQMVLDYFIANPKP